MTGNCLYHIVRHLRRSVKSKNFFVLRQYLVADTQTIAARQKIRPNLMVTTSGGQHLNETVCVEDYVAHDIQRLL